MEEQETGMDVEVLAPSAIESLNRSEIQSQIEIAKRYPRSMERFKTRASEMACMDEETAASCLYRRPVGQKNGKMEFAEGMSIRMAEIVGACYGNVRVYATLLSQDERQVVARGMAIDLENNFASSSEIVESTVTRDGKPFSERMRIVVAKAALAKARRDAMFQVVPRALAKPIEQRVRKLLLGEAKSIERRREQVGAWIKTMGIDENRVWEALGVNGMADVGLKEIETLTGLHTAIRDGEVSIEEAFPPRTIAAPQPLRKEPKDEQEKHTGVSKTSPNMGQGEEADVSPLGKVASGDDRILPGRDQKTQPTKEGKAAAKKGKAKVKADAKEADRQTEPDKEVPSDVPGDGDEPGTDAEGSMEGAAEGEGPAEKTLEERIKDESVSIADRIIDWCKNCELNEILTDNNFLTKNFARVAKEEPKRQIEVLKHYNDRRQGKK